MKSKLSLILIVLTTFFCSGLVAAQNRTTLTGTVLSYGTGLSTRMSSRNFTFHITRTSSEADEERLLAALQRGGQNGLLDAIKHENLGNFSLGARVGRRVNFIRVENIEGRKRIIAVFERWLEFAELRGGYRSLDYPFSYIELFVDPRTGRAEGTFFAAAKIRLKGGDMEVEDFATFPSKLFNVKLHSGGRLQ